MTAETMYALVIRDDAVVGDLIDLLVRVPMCDMERWMDGAVALLADAEEFREAVANQTRWFVERGAENSPTLSVLAHICVFGQWGAPAALLAKAFALKIGHTSTQTTSMVTPEIAHHLLAPACIAVPRDVLPEVVPASLLGFVRGNGWFHPKDSLEKWGARAYVAPASAQDTLEAKMVARDAATAAFVTVMTTPVAPEKKEPVSEKIGKCTPVVAERSFQDRAPQTASEATRDAPESPKKKGDVRTFNLSWRGDPFEYDATAMRADDEKIERKAVTVLGSPLGNRLMEFHLKINRAIFDFTDKQKSLLVWDYAASCLKLREDVEQALIGYYEDYEE